MLVNFKTISHDTNCMKNTHFHLNSFAHSEYSHSECGNYTNSGKNDYNNINMDDCYYRESQFAFKYKYIISLLFIIHFNERS